MGTNSSNRLQIETRIQELKKIKKDILNEREMLQSKLDELNGVSSRNDNKTYKNALDDPNVPNRDYFMDYVFPEDNNEELLPNGKKRFLDPKRIYIKTNYELNNKDLMIQDKEDNLQYRQQRRRESEIVYVDQLDPDILDMI